MQPTVADIAALLGVTEESVRRQFAVNAVELRQMARTAARMGRTYRGKTAAEWRRFADHAERQSK